MLPDASRADAAVTLPGHGFSDRAQMSLRRNDPVPLYYQLLELLREQIESGQVGSGERIPSVSELSKRCQISPVTVRQAIGELVLQGLLEVRRGIGTFVAAPKLPYNLLSLTGFTEDMHSLGLTAHTKLLILAEEAPTGRIAESLHILREEQVVHIRRLRSSDGIPTVLDESFLPCSICPGLVREDLVRNSLYELLETRYRLTLDHATQTLEAVSADPYEAELLGVSVSAPMVMIRGVTLSTDSRPVEYFKDIYRGDRFRFQLQTIRLRKQE